MARYLWQVSYTAEGAKGVLKEGGSSRRDLVQGLVKDLGGSVETFDFAFGDYDAYVIVEVPDSVTAAAISMTVAAAGAARVKTVALLTPEELDEATRKSVAYRAPGA